MLTNSYHSIESTSSSRSLFKQLTSWLTNATGAMFNLLLVEPDAEPRVAQVQGQTGELFWEIYEPISGQTYYCMSEDEALQWFDRNRWM